MSTRGIISKIVAKWYYCDKQKMTCTCFLPHMALIFIPEFQLVVLYTHWLPDQWHSITRHPTCFRLSHGRYLSLCISLLSLTPTPPDHKCDTYNKSNALPLTPESCTSMMTYLTLVLLTHGQYHWWEVVNEVKPTQPFELVWAELRKKCSTALCTQSIHTSCKSPPLQSQTGLVHQMKSIQWLSLLLTTEGLKVFLFTISRLREIATRSFTQINFLERLWENQC